MVASGEDISIGLRRFTHGFDFYAPSTNVAFHTTSSSYDGTNIKDMQTKIWDKNSNKSIIKNSLMRLLGMINMNLNIDDAMWSHREENKYGLGNVRTASKFFQYFGMHVQVKRIEQKLCYFVQSGQMHNLFSQSLRRNGMGIDYDRIHFRFHEKAVKD